MTTTETTETADQLDTNTAQLEAATNTTADARDEHAAAKAARGDAIITRTHTTAHNARVLTAQKSLEVCLEVEDALTRHRRVLTGAAPPLHTAVTDARPVRVIITGRPGVHACNQPSTGRALIGGDAVTLPADDALSLAAGGYVRMAGALPSWWPHGVPIPDESTHNALSDGRGRAH